MDKEFIAEMQRRIDEKNNISQEEMLEEAARYFNFITNYDPGKPSNYPTLEEVKRDEVKEYLEKQNLLIGEGGFDRDAKSLITEYRDIKIKDVVNENHVQWLYESGKIVDNADGLANTIINKIKKEYNKKSTPIQVYQLKTGKIQYREIKFAQDISVLDIRSHPSINVYCIMYDCITQEQIDELKNSNKLNLGFVWVKNTMEIPIAKLGKDWDKLKILTGITHELTHKFQTSNNSKITNEKDYNEYLKQYTNVTTQAIENSNSYFRLFSFICYYFTKSEISANINELNTELRNKKNITRDNYMSIYKLTSFYKKHSDILEKYQLLCSQPDGKWAKFRDLAQQFGFYKPTMRLNTTQDGMVFKKHWIGFIDRMIEYTNKSVNRVLYTMIENKK